MSKVTLKHAPSLLGILSRSVGRNLELKSISSYGLSKWDVNTALKTVTRIEEHEVHQQQLEKLGLEHAEDSEVDKRIPAVSKADKETNRVLADHDALIKRVAKTSEQTSKSISKLESNLYAFTEAMEFAKAERDFKRQAVKRKSKK